MDANESRQARIDAAKIKHANAIISGNKIGTDRYEYLKNKKSQADGSTANVVVIKDKGAGTQFTIAVNVSAIRFDGEQPVTTDDRLDQLQASVTKYLLSIHEEL